MLGALAPLVDAVLGTLVPAYLAAKALRAPRPRADEAARWARVFLARCLLSLACASVLDATLFWLPLYSELKIAAGVWLWWPVGGATGADTLFDRVAAPLLDEHGASVEAAAVAAREAVAAAARAKLGDAVAAARGAAAGAVGALQGVQARAAVR